MSRHGPPPGDPYGSRPGSGDYGPPSDPWGRAPEGDTWGHPPDTWGGPATTPPSGYPEPRQSGPYGEPRHDRPPYREPWYGEPEHADHGYPDPSPYSDLPPGGPPPRRNIGLYAVVAVLVVLAAAGVGYALFLLTGDDDPRAGGIPGPTATGPDTATPEPGASPGDNIGLSAAVARVDDCLVNEGSSDQTQMRIVRCDEEGQEGVVYRVLAVVTEPVEGEDDQARHVSAQAICTETEGYTHHYFEVDDESSFVLCMAQLE